jgi:hypothetical protein
MVWNYIIFFVVAFAISYALIPKAQSRPPPGINEFKVPTAEEGREIPVLFGTKNIVSPNVVWFGDIRTVPIQRDTGKK